MASSTSANNGSAEVTLRASITTSLKRACVLILSFTAAVALLSTTIVILAPIFVAISNRFPSLLNMIAGGSNPSHEKIIYIPPTQDDLDRIRQELEVSEVLPAINMATEDSDNPRSASRIRSVISTTESQLQQLEREFNTVMKEVDDLTVAYDSWLERWAQDMSRNELSVVDESAVTQYFESRLVSLRTILGGQSFMDLDMQNVTQIIATAIEELRWMTIKSDDEYKKILFLNSNNMLLKVLTTESIFNDNDTNQSCHESYLDLNDGNPSIELILKPNAVKKLSDSDAITKETALESDLYDLVEDIKGSLSWHDIESMPRPPLISDEGMNDIRSNIAPMVTSIVKMRRSSLANEKKVRDYWVDRIETFVSDVESSEFEYSTDENEDLLCSSSSLVKGMIEEGLEAFRRNGDLRSELEGVALRAVKDASPEITDILWAQLQETSVPKTNGARHRSSMPHHATTSSWKVGKKSIAYAVDGPWLRRGVVNWIDYFIDVVSGYNDYIDSLFDWFVGDSGASVGSALVSSFLKLIGRITLPKSVGRMKRSGIIAGRMRGILEG